MEDHSLESSLHKQLRPSERDKWRGPYRLLFCSSKGDKAGIIQELEKGVNANLADYDKRTALHLASCEGFSEIILLLIEKGADVNSLDRWGRTPLSDARRSGHVDICEILEAHGGIDQELLDSQIPCFEIDSAEINWNERTLIGEGAYGEVYLVKWRGTTVAAKTIRSSIASHKTVKDNFLKEFSLWAKLRHPNIVQFLGVLKQPDRLVFLTEYLRNGSLYDILHRKGRLDQLTAVAYALDIARGMNYLHKHKPHAIIHRDLTPRFLKRKGVGFEVLGKKIYLFGGCGWIEDASDEVFSYDASVNTWTEASALSTARCFFAHEALDGKIYAIGGLGSKSSDPHSWDIYDSHTNSWSSHADPNVIPDIEDSLIMDGKIYIRARISAASSQVNAVVYDPSSQTWQPADADMACWCGPAVVIDDVLYVLDQNSGVRLMMWQKDTRAWMGLRRISEHLVRPPCRLVAIGKKIFVIGKGLSTLMFDVESASCVDGVLVSSSVLMFNCDVEVISCKCLAI